MDLKDGEITIGEIMSNPEAAEIIKGRVPMLTPSLIHMFSGITLNKAKHIMQMYKVPKEEIKKIEKQILKL